MTGPTDPAERPLFLDPVPDDAGEAVGDAGIPRWFVSLALLLVFLSGYYLAMNWSGS